MLKRCRHSLTFSRQCRLSVDNQQTLGAAAAPPWSSKELTLQLVTTAQVVSLLDKESLLWGVSLSSHAMSTTALDTVFGRFRHF